MFKFCMLQPHPSSEDILIVPENEYCQSERMTIFVGSIYAYKGLLMVCFSLYNILRSLHINCKKKFEVVKSFSTCNILSWHFELISLRCSGT